MPESETERSGARPESQTERSGARPESALSARVDLALLGVRGSLPVRRSAGAGPSDDGHLVINGINAAIPRNPLSPYVLEGDQILLDGSSEDLGLDVSAIDRPAFYDLRTDSGTEYEKIAKLHGRDVLASTVMQTCICLLYTSPSPRDATLSRMPSSA